MKVTRLIYSDYTCELCQEFPHIEAQIVKDIYENLGRDVEKTRRVILEMCGLDLESGNNSQDPIEPENIKILSNQESPKILNNSNKIVFFPVEEDFPVKNEISETEYKRQTAEHINVVLYSKQENTTKKGLNKDYSNQEKDPPPSQKTKLFKNRNRNKKPKPKRKKMYRLESDEEEDLVYQDRRSDKLESLSSKTRESISNMYELDESDGSVMTFSSIFDEFPEMTQTEKEELMGIIKNDHSESWDQYDQKSFKNTYKENQMIEDIVSSLTIRKKPKNLFYSEFEKRMV